MPSPFPGMNPFLEHPHTWNDFHQTFLTFLREALTAAVAPHYYVRIDEHLYVHEYAEDEPKRAGRGDLAITRERNGNGTQSGGAVLTAPARGRIVIPDFDRQFYLEVRDRHGGEVVTVIELLSPANKHAGKDHEHYLTKRDEIIWSPAHFVEIDLLGGGVRPPIEGLPKCDYYVLVGRADDRPEVELWPFGIRDPLPLIPIPLRDPDPDARLELRPALDRAYDSAQYEHVIYNSAPVPRLSADIAAWSAQYVPAKAP